MFSTFGPDTLKELRQHSVVGWAHHVNRFTDMHDIGDVLVHAGFSHRWWIWNTSPWRIRTWRACLKNLRRWAAQCDAGRRHGMMGKSEWLQLQSSYEQCRRDGRLPATFEVVYGMPGSIKKNWKPQMAVKLFRCPFSARKACVVEMNKGFSLLVQIRCRKKHWLQCIASCFFPPGKEVVGMKPIEQVANLAWLVWVAKM